MSSTGSQYATPISTAAQSTLSDDVTETIVVEDDDYSVLQGHAQVKHLVLRGCSVVDPMVCQLAALETLTMEDCTMQSLLYEVGKLQALQRLKLLRCNQLVDLPDSLTELQALQMLELLECHKLVSLPESLGELQALQTLKLLECHKLVSLPESLGELQALQTLELLECDTLVSLPESLGELQALRTLYLLGSKLVSLPESLGQLQALQDLDLVRCNKLVSLPESLGQLQALQRLDLGFCCALVSLPESLGQLPSLTFLDLSYCTSLQSLPDSCDQLVALRVLMFSDCPVFKTLECGIRWVAWWNAVMYNAIHCHSVVMYIVVMYMFKLYESRRLRSSPGRAHLVGKGTLTKGYQIVSFIVKQQRQRRQHQAAVTKLATQQDTMLNTLERMSWLVVLLATATFVAFMQPPGGASEQHQVIVSNVTSCAAPSPELLKLGMSGFMQCAMLMFFVFDGLSFSLSIGCLVLIVNLSMPRIQWADQQAEAGRFYVLLLLTWSLLYLAVSWVCCICGFWPSSV